MSDSPWPDGYRSAACFTFDLDADEIWNLRIESDEAWDKPPIRTRGEFGPNVAVPRILELFDRYDLRCTFFIPGRVAEDWPETVRAIHEAGHEIGHHGYRHVNPSNFDSRAEEEADVKEALDVFDDLLGETPVGYRSPASDLSDHTLELLAEHGIRWESTFMDDDRPYVHDEGIVEIPFDWSLDDWPYFGYQMYPQLPYQSGITPTGPVFDSWRREFDGLHKRGRAFTLTMHPQIIGRAGRIDALEELIQHVLATGDAWITTGEEIAERWETGKN
ncbi:Peptidoglycan/xylan/chitin deacetylase, PgdA/CDA1 family [Halorubrum aquaticum]|uniref:Peptidoglycan/xylan/chitin deacetylase, PgdA/CDA1 family n=1 Tax=Halorubrum aquaticum TaxID=387340 RepID=A0A1I3BNR0_9EURY|nr:polysaccharide deacetylase [Halorubrum aquaticum]SFH63736.1 Peptidoglycan/xylan/chitin deacetylase, PgdA/CDA1 family [Halorubrum aquaticum]